MQGIWIGFYVYFYGFFQEKFTTITQVLQRVYNLDSRCGIFMQKHGMSYPLKPSKGVDIVVGLICLVFDEYNFGGTTWIILMPAMCSFDRCSNR